MKRNSIGNLAVAIKPENLKHFEPNSWDSPELFVNPAFSFHQQSSEKIQICDFQVAFLAKSRWLSIEVLMEQMRPAVMEKREHEHRE